jgi:glycosyltransferase involved in cell wall biosynthesis
MRKNFETPPRVLHCLWNSELGGLNTAVYQLVKQQLAAGKVLPSVLVAEGAGGPWWERFSRLGCPLIGLNVPGGASLMHVPAARRSMRLFDIHHFHAIEPVLFCASLGCRGVTRVYTHRAARYLPDYSLRKRVRYGLGGLALKFAFHGLSGNTKHGAECAAALFDIPAANIRVTYNGVDFSRLEPTRSPAAVRAELGLGEHVFVLGTVSILKDFKRIERLVELCSAVDDLHLVIVGDGPGRPKLEALSLELDLQSRVIFTGLRQHVPDYLQIMDAFCLPATTESFGNSAVEAMALGVPTIVFTDGGGIIEHILNGETGFIVEDKDDLEATLRSLMHDAVLRRKIGESGRAAIRTRYTLDMSGEAYEDLYASALSTRRRGVALSGAVA